MTDLSLELDPLRGRRSGLEHALRLAISAGRLAPGAPLPPSRTLAADLGMARGTVVNAYEQLIAEGYLIGRPGVGTTVAHRVEPLNGSAHGNVALRHHLLNISLVPGESDRSSFPRAAWMASFRHVLDTAPDELFGYGRSTGLPGLCTALADHLARARSVRVRADDIHVFGGYSDALHHLLHALTVHGVTRMAVEDPCIPSQRATLEHAGIEICPIPVDAEGLDVDRLRASGVHAVIVTPGHQYPTGVVMGPERRRQLIDWATSTGGWVIEDDYDGEFRYDPNPPPALQGMGPDRVIYAGTVSKTLAAGLRIGWLAVPEELGASMRTLRDRCSVSSVEQATFASMLSTGRLDRHVRQMRQRYRKRRLLLERTISTIPTLRLIGAAAGLHLTVVLAPGGPDEAAVVRAGLDASLTLWSLSHHFAPQASAHLGRGSTEGIVLGFSRSSDAAFMRALRDLPHVMAAAVTRSAP